MFERFTEKAIKVVMLSQEESRRLGHNFVGTEQILLGLIGEGTGVAYKVLRSVNLTLKDARMEVERIIGRGSGFVAVEIPFTPRAKRVLENSIEVRYILFSRNGDGVEAYKQLVSAWCSKNKEEAVESLFEGDILDDVDICENPLDKNSEYASLLSVEGTPTIFLEDGRVIPGYQNSKNIIAFINN